MKKWLTNERHFPADGDSAQDVIRAPPPLTPTVSFLLSSPDSRALCGDTSVGSLRRRVKVTRGVTVAVN